MSESVNPYSPPPIGAGKSASKRSLLKRLFSGFWRIPNRGSPDFRNGDAFIVAGIGYFIDPSDNTTLFAGAPSEDHSDERLALIARESIRYLPDLLEELADHRHDLISRRLVVRIVQSYSGIGSDYHRAVEVLNPPISDHVSRMNMCGGNQPMHTEPPSTGF